MPSGSEAGRRRTAAHVLYALVLAALIGYAYGPSLRQLPRADDWWYYLNTLDTHSFHDTFLASYSYARTRTVMPGDESFFRPLLFALLAFKKDGIGPHFFWHQAIPLALHWCFCFLTMLLLERLRDAARYGPASEPTARTTWADVLCGALVYALPAYIAVNAAIFDAVIWTHITGYLLFYVLTLSAFYLCVHGSNSHAPAPRWSGVVLALALFACVFLYEYGQFYAIVLAPWALFWNRPFRDRLILVTAVLCVPVVYQVGNAMDKRANARAVDRPADMNFYADSLSKTVSPVTLQSMYRFTRYAGGVPMFPSTALIAEKEERILVHELSIRRALNESHAALLGLAVLPVWMLLAIAGYVVAARKRARRVAAAALTLLAFFGLYALGISLVRLNPDAHQELVLAGSSYYMYWPFTLSMVILSAGLFLLVGLTKSRFSHFAASSVTLALLIYLAVEGSASANRLREFNTALAESQAPSQAIVDSVNRFFAAHPDATVAFDLAHSIDVPDTWDLGVPLTTLLYRERENDFSPTFIVRIREGTVDASPPESPAIDAVHPLVPHLACVSRDMNIYLYEGKYFGLLRFEGHFDPANRGRYRYPAVGSTIDDVVRQSTDLLARRDADVAAGTLRNRYWH